jgi:hypothetical protein
MIDFNLAKRQDELPQGLLALAAYAAACAEFVDGADDFEPWEPRPLGAEADAYADEPQRDADAAAEPERAQITLITKRDTPALMSKRISLDGEGNVKSDGSECRMISGTAARALVATASALAQIIANCRSNQAIALGALKAELLASVAVTIPNRLDMHPGAITRSRSYIDYRPGVPAWCLIDFDTKGMPDEVKTKIDAAGGMWNALLTVAPEFANAARVSRASTSAGLSRTDTGEPIAVACTIMCLLPMAATLSGSSKTCTTVAGCTASAGI